MATDLKTPQHAVPRHELFVEQQLERVSKRIHFLDVGRSLCALLAVVLGHALVMALLDLAAGPKPAAWIMAVRIGIWGVSLTLALALGCMLAWRCLARINPYYAARRIEDTIPDAKNSVVNWLDLREKKLPPVVKNALGLRAAHDLKGTEPELSIHSKNTWILSSLAGLLALGLAGLLVAEPGRFPSLMQRAFLPMGQIALSTRTQITLLEPAGGDVTVTPQQKIRIQARITGVVPRINTPHAARLLFRYQPDEGWASLPLELDRDGTWIKNLDSDQVQNGFSYKVQAGDAETPEYQVTVQSLPEAKRWELAYHYPSYLRRADSVVTFPNEDAVNPTIKAPRGTEATLVVRTNRELFSARLELMSGKDVQEYRGDVLADDPRAFRVQLKPLEKSGQFRIRFTTKAGDENTDLRSYDVEVIPDGPPTVELTSPGQDVELPANGILQLDGAARDDFGIKRLTLRLEISQGPTKTGLEPKEYRPEKDLQFTDGSYPKLVKYKDFVALDQLKKLTGGIQPLAKGDVISYWLEATDNCEYPDGKNNLGHSPIFKVVIGNPVDAKKQQEERRLAEQQQRSHEQQQDNDLKQREKELSQAGRTNITLLLPVGGNVTVPPAQKVLFQAKITGVVPRPNAVDAARLLHRHKADATWQSMPLEPDRDGTWTASMPADQVLNGFSYKLQAGDAETPTYQVKVSALPQAVRFELVHRYPPYLRQADRALAYPNEIDVIPRIKSLRGTEVTLVVRTNRDLRTAKVELISGKDVRPVPGDLLPEDANAFRVKFVLEKSGQFRIRFTTKSGEENTDVAPYDVDVIPDQAPIVELTSPGMDVQLPANGTLELKGHASDDFGLKKLTLKLQLKHGQKNVLLADKEYRAGKPLQFADGSYPLRLDYQDLLALDQLKTPDGSVQTLAKGDVLFYWLEATDNCEYPVGKNNVGKSQIYKVTIGDPADAKTQQAERQQFEQEQKNHERKQDQDLKQQEKEAKGNADRSPEQQATKELVKGLLDKVQQQEKKEGEPGTGEPGSSGTGDAKKEMTPEDVKKLKEMQKQGGAIGELANRELEKAKRSKNAETSKAAEEALQNRPPQPSREPSHEDLEKLKEMLKDKGPLGQAAAREMLKIAKETKDKLTRKTAEDALQNRPPDAKDQPKQELTEKDLNELKDLLKKQGPIGEMAAKELEEAAKNAKSDQTKKAAQEALQNRPAPSPSGREPTPEDVAKLEKILEDKGPVGDAARKELEKMTKQAGSDTRKAAEKALQKNPRGSAGKELTEKDVARFKELLGKTGPVGDLAAKELQEAVKNAKKPEVSKAAAEALQNRPRPEPTAEEMKQLKEMLKKPGPVGNAAERELSKIKKETRDDATRKAAEEALQGKPKASADDRKELDKTDVSQLKEMLKNDGRVSDMAARELQEAVKNAKPEVSKAAEEALQNRPSPTGKETSPQDIEQFKKMLKEKGAVAQAGARELQRLSKEGKTEEIRNAAKEALQREPGAKAAGGAPAEKGTRKEPTLEDIAKLKESAKKEGLTGDLSTRKLAEAGRTAKDDKVRQAANQAFQEALKNRKDGKPQDVNLGDVARLKDLAKQKGQTGAAAARELERLARQAANEEIRKAAKEGLKESGRDPQTLRHPDDPDFKDKKARDPIKDATREDVAQQKEMLKKEGLPGDVAAERLEEMKRLAKDKDVAREAGNALKTRDPNKTEELTAEDIAKLKEMLKDPGPLGDDAAREVRRLMSEQARNPAVRKAAETAFREWQDRRKAPDAEASRRAGNLTLEDINTLKQKLTPEMLKDAGLSREQVQRILKEMEEKIAPATGDAATKLGGPSQLSNTGPMLRGPDANATGSTPQGIRGNPPPGFRDVYNRWSTAPRAKNADGQ